MVHIVEASGARYSRAQILAAFPPVERPQKTATEATPTTDVGSAAATKSFVHWPEAMIALGLSLTVAWACVLGYGLVKILELVI